MTDAVGEVGPFADSEPPDGARVPALRTAQHDPVSGQRGRLSEEDRRPQGRPARLLRAPKPLAAVEGIAQAGEEALLAWRELARRRFLPAQLGELAKQFFLLRLQLGRRLHGDMDDQVAPAGAVQPLGAAPEHRDRLAGLRPRADVQIGGTVQGVHRERRAERRGRHGNRHGAVQVVTLPLEDLVRPLHDLQEQVAGRPAAGTGLTLAGQLDVGTVLDPGRDPYLDRAPGPDPAVRVALWTRLADDRAVATARGAGPRRHHLADEGPGDLADLTPAVADIARDRVRARRGALAGAGRAHDGGVNDEFPGRAERSFRQV